MPFSGLSSHEELWNLTIGFISSQWSLFPFKTDGFALGMGRRVFGERLDAGVEDSYGSLAYERVLLTFLLVLP